MTGTCSVLFVCLHGSAKSLIAREHFARLARDAGYDVDVRSAGIEPDDAVPPGVLAGLARDGIDASVFVPEPLVNDALERADVVVSFGCALEPPRGRAPTIRWDDLPLVSDGYEEARTAIVTRLRQLLADVVAPIARGRCASPNAK